jgi:hypothetical protein
LPAALRAASAATSAAWTIPPLGVFAAHLASAFVDQGSTWLFLQLENQHFVQFAMVVVREAL